MYDIKGSFTSHLTQEDIKAAIVFSVEKQTGKKVKDVIFNIQGYDRGDFGSPDTQASVSASVTFEPSSFKVE